MTPLRIAILAGEESGDQLGADLVRALQAMTGRPVELIGVGGPHLQALGLKPLFDPGEIAIMGISAVLRDLPRLLRRIGQTARLVTAAKPDCLITIDSPEFNLRVSKKVRAADPSIPIVKYVCPSVWAWRPGRAPAMAPYIDHVLCLLPFEPEALERLGGPPGTYVGHRMTHDAGLIAAAEAQLARQPGTEEKTLVLLPGSRRSEVKTLLDDFGAVVKILHGRGHRLRLLLPTVARVAPMVEAETASWPVTPEISTDPAAKWKAFGEGDAALAASGTVSLELALARLPFVVTYKMDWIARRLLSLIKTWSVSLPNLIADRAIVPEFYNEAVRPPMMSRYVEALFEPGPARDAQRQGFAMVAEAMATARPSGELAAEVVLGEMEKRRVASSE